MAKDYMLGIKSQHDLSGDSKIKTIHAVLSHLFERTGWSKGNPYPDFKISSIAGSNVVLTSPVNIANDRFSFDYGPFTTEVFVKEIGNDAGYNFKKGDSVVAMGTISMYKNSVKGNKRSKVAMVRTSYPDMILDKCELNNKIREQTGIIVKSIAVQPVYVSKSIMPNNKQINSAFDINVLGEVEDFDLANSLSYRSIGKDISYGFGALTVRLFDA